VAVSCVAIEISDYMSKLLDPLRTTDLLLHRVWVLFDREDQWYAVMRELHQAFGRNWQGQKKIRRQFTRRSQSQLWLHANILPSSEMVSAWFDVPDVGIFTWISIKYSVDISLTAPSAKTINNKSCF